MRFFAVLLAGVLVSFLAVPSDAEALDLPAGDYEFTQTTPETPPADDLGGQLTVPSDPSMPGYWKGHNGAQGPVNMPGGGGPYVVLPEPTPEGDRLYIFEISGKKTWVRTDSNGNYRASGTWALK